MQNLNFYTTLLTSKQETEPTVATHLEEEINILIHKLKFIPQEQRPTVLILTQHTGFQPLYNEQIADSVAIAGGALLAEPYDNPALLLIVQQNEALYTDILNVLQEGLLNSTDAVQSNNVYIIQKSDFGMDTEGFLPDIEICAEIIQPKYFIYGRKGTDWVQFDMA